MAFRGNGFCHRLRGLDGCPVKQRFPGRLQEVKEPRGGRAIHFQGFSLLDGYEDTLQCFGDYNLNFGQGFFWRWGGDSDENFLFL